MSLSIILTRPRNISLSPSIHEMVLELIPNIPRNRKPFRIDNQWRPSFKEEVQGK
jgi:hypothetical protein